VHAAVHFWLYGTEMLPCAVRSAPVSPCRAEVRVQGSGEGFVDVSNYKYVITITFVGSRVERQCRVMSSSFRSERTRGRCLGRIDRDWGVRWLRVWRDGPPTCVLCAARRNACACAEELRALGVQTLALGCDVKDKAAIQEVVNATLAKFGRIDILINNAGVSWAAPVEEMTLEQWDKVLSTNLTGTFLFSQAAGKAMVAQSRAKLSTSHPWRDWAERRRSCRRSVTTRAKGV